ncbi:hypothetical protein NQ109_29565 [Priestia megaterium]|uniref:hypothetical protein n=1 Tax=Priestia megaterium TaxID=1404 RepID=UPI00215A3E22|nr:hypothetical protein [Priestia megaterium]MCR8867080.1 hypothetical protein [Priestia megaterium]
MFGVLIATVSFNLYGCSTKPDLLSFREDVDPLIEDTNLNKYIIDIDDDVKYSFTDKKNGTYINLDVQAEDTFNELNTEEAFDVLKDAAKYLTDNVKLPKCGDDDCKFGTLKVAPLDIHGDDTYKMNIDDTSNEYTMVWNGDSYKEEDLYRYEDDEDESTEVSTTATDDEIYRYMQDMYDQLTNYGENYTPEIHDPQVARAAAEKFNITEEEAGQIYVDKEVEKANSY